MTLGCLGATDRRQNTPVGVAAMASDAFTIIEGDSPIVAAAIHDGHEVREEVAELLALDEVDRLREEDPHTSLWTAVAPTRIVGLRSRFEVDLNRPRGGAVYRRPEDAWGLQMWSDSLPPGVATRSLKEYDDFYRRVRNVLAKLEDKFGGFVVLDLHTYNHRRGGPDAPPDDPAKNPQVNVGTGSMNRAYWAPLVDRFVEDLRTFEFPGGRLDVRENVRFRGGHFVTWIHRHFPRSGCALAIEFKKTFMDEWTGEADESLLRAIGDALRSTVGGLLEQFQCHQTRRQLSRPRSTIALSGQSVSD
jgi:N-formylglutamate amidohydrolase